MAPSARIRMVASRSTRARSHLYTPYARSWLRFLHQFRRMITFGSSLPTTTILCKDRSGWLFLRLACVVNAHIHPSMLRFPTLRNAQNFLHHLRFLVGNSFPLSAFRFPLNKKTELYILGVFIINNSVIARAVRLVAISLC